MAHILHTILYFYKVCVSVCVCCVCYVYYVTTTMCNIIIMYILSTKCIKIHPVRSVHHTPGHNMGGEKKSGSILKQQYDYVRMCQK